MPVETRNEIPKTKLLGITKQEPVVYEIILFENLSVLDDEKSADSDSITTIKLECEMAAVREINELPQHFCFQPTPTA
jgi:hypothetical protein